MKPLYFILLLISPVLSAQTFRFANYYQDNMVLQRGQDVSAVVWGYQPCDEQVKVTFRESAVLATTTKSGDVCTFSAKLQPTVTPGPYTITATCGNSQPITLNNILFGDVWICGGQSNMVFTVPQVYNATDEIAKADKYPDIRLFTVQRVSSATPLDEVPVILQPWSVASSKTINGGAWQYFSAACWFYARNLYDKYKVPLGMVSSNWGGTRVEAWSSPDALAACNSTSKFKEYQKIETVLPDFKQSFAGPNPNEVSVLWNGMMKPFLNMTIYGAIWYQGESNAGNPEAYNCSFPAMIYDWRKKFHEANDGNSLEFPFGFVQLSAVNSNNQTVGGFPGIRWSETASYGYVPNSALSNVFMAVSMDLGDPTSPFGSVHPRDKETVGERLALAGSAVAYGDKSVYYTGPLVTSATSSLVTFHNIPEGQTLQMRSPYGFEVACQTGTDIMWFPGTAEGIQGGNSVAVSFPKCPMNPENMKYTMIRYAWREDPCTYLNCSIYCNELPSPPFIIPLSATP
jgi:sialate O-acetylesterase